MKLPNGDQAIVDPVRLFDYVLNPSHRTGQHKARVFMSALGLTRADVDVLHAWLLDIARTGHAVVGRADAFGVRYTIVATLRFSGREAVVRTGWIMRAGQSSPEFLTAFVE